MNVRAMHYDIKLKLNKIDSNQNRIFRIPEIDMVLNEACNTFIKSVAEPRIAPQLGFETSQRTIDDIRTLVINNKELIPVRISNTEYYVELPDNYMFYISSYVDLKRGNCSSRESRCILRQHDDMFKESPFDKSSYEWKEVNITFYEKGIKIHTDGTFEIEKLKLNYIRKHAYIHNAQDFLPNREYKDFYGNILTGSQDCELPEHTHNEIVDIAVLILAGNLGLPEYQFKQAKLNLNS